MKPFQLDQRPKIDPGFRTPDGYFDALPDAVFARLAQPEPKIIRMRPIRAVWYAAAAILVVALTLPLGHYLRTSPDPDDAALEQYLLTQSGLSPYDLAETLTEADLRPLEADIPVNDQAIEEALSDNANLEYYLTY